MTRSALCLVSLLAACGAPPGRGPAVSTVLELREEPDGSTHTEHRVSYAGPGVVDRVDTIWQGALLRATRYVYDGAQVVAVQDRAGPQVSEQVLRYDGERLEEVSLGSGNSTLYDYDAHGRLIASRHVDAAGTSSELRYSYDGFDRLVRIESPRAKSAVTLVRDGSGAVVEVIEDFRNDAHDRTWALEYSAGRLVRVTRDREALEFSYSARGFLEQIEAQSPGSATHTTIELTEEEAIGTAFSPPFALGTFFDLEGHALDALELPRIALHER